MYKRQGDSVQLTGSGYPVYACVDEMTIGGISVKPIACVWTGSDGSFVKTVSVPTISSGTKTVYVRVSSRSADSSFYVFTPPTPTPSPTAVPTPTPLPTATPMPTPTPTPTPVPTASLDLDVSYGYPGDSIQLTLSLIHI